MGKGPKTEDPRAFLCFGYWPLAGGHDLIVEGYREVEGHDPGVQHHGWLHQRLENRRNQGPKIVENRSLTFWAFSDEFDN